MVACEAMDPLDLLHLDVVASARQMIGWTLVSHAGGATTSGVIVETEAYRAADDPAAHAYRGRTVRNAPMWLGAGTIYVYRSYGLHHMLNFVTGVSGAPESVLIRAIEPVIGIQFMQERRGLEPLRSLTSGPAKLTQAMAIDVSLTGTNLGTMLNLIPPDRKILESDVTSAKRIGISSGKDLPWRFYAINNPYVSRH